MAQNNEKRSSLLLLTFSIFRTTAWLILGICIILGILHIAGFNWAWSLARSLPFVVLISIYANWATDLGSTMTAFTTLVASRAHSDAASSRDLLTELLPKIRANVEELASLPPSEEGKELAEKIVTDLEKHAER